jgi:cysteine desulfurase
MTNSWIYLDYAAATPVDARVMAAMQPFFSDDFYNPSAAYWPAKEVAKKLQDARSAVAQILGARGSEIIFTAGGTEADNLAVQGVMRQFPEGNVVISAIEHDAIRETARQFNCREVQVDAQGIVDLHDLEEKIDNKTLLVSVIYASNEIGTVQPIREIAKIIAEKRAVRVSASETRDSRLESRFPLYFHTDASQAANYLDLHVARLGVDLMTLNGGKIYGPKQSGGLFVKSGVQLQPLIFGGGQERNVRSGTENVAFSIGFSKALEITQEIRQEETRRLQKLQQEFFRQLSAAFPDIRFNGSLKKRLPNNVHVTFSDQDNERILMELEQHGVLASAGSACSASDEKSSHVLRAMGFSDAEARASVRLTLGRNSSEADIAKTVKALKNVV